MEMEKVKGRARATNLSFKKSQVGKILIDLENHVCSNIYSPEDAEPTKHSKCCGKSSDIMFCHVLLLPKCAQKDNRDK